MMIPSLSGKHFIDGRWQEGSGEAIAVENPATGETIGSIAAGTAEEVALAVAAARRAFRPWADLPGKARAAALRRLGGAIAADADTLARVMTTEQGKPLNEARGEIMKLAEACQFYAEEAVRIHGEVIPNDAAEHRSIVLREPVGVVGAITPWNYPAELVGWKLCAALAAGCTIVIKPAELTPFTALAIARKVEEAGIPAGVVNVVTGRGDVAGMALVKHPDVDKIAFTGSSRVGLVIQQSCVNIKRLSLELGCNCPVVVTASADIDAAVKGVVRRSFRNMGQICIAINRVYVARPIYETFLDKLAAAAEQLTIANGIENPGADLGPMASAEPLAKTKDHLADALAKGARLVTGGAAPDGQAFERGHFFRPTVVADCTHEHKVMTEETFGPLIGVMPFDTLDEAVALANDTPYGLAAYLYANDLNEVHHATSRLDFGNVAVNNVDAGVMNAPYGGRKQSGIGYEHGREGMLEYLNYKHIRMQYAVPKVS